MFYKFSFSPDVLKQEMKVFFVKYNDPIYVKMEKLDIMIRLAQQNNITQVLSELKEYAAEVDVDFVRKAVRAIGRCAIKVEQSSEKCVATLLDLIQTKVNYVVQEAVVVIKDIFRKYPNRYENIISNLCENLDTLDEPEARASMIWIIGEYAERIDNADELLESFVEGFHDENTQVQLQLLTAVVKLFLKRPTDTQQLVQRVLSLATQDSDNPDLRDRGYIYWRLLSADPGAAKEVVLAEKPLISEETDLLEPSLLNQLVCHIGSLASVYHKPPTSFIDSTRQPLRGAPVNTTSAVSPQSNEANIISDITAPPQTTIIPSQDNLIADLLSLDLTAPAAPSSYQPTQSAIPGLDDLLGGFDSMGTTNTSASRGGFGLTTAMPQPAATANPDPLDIFGVMGNGSTTVFEAPQQSSAVSNGYVPPKELWLDASKGKGLQIEGTFARRSGTINMEMVFTNKVMQPLSDFAIQFNTNSYVFDFKLNIQDFYLYIFSFGLTPAGPIDVGIILPNQSANVQLACRTNGPAQRTEPLTDLQVSN